MNAPPLLFGGRSPVVAYLRHSMIVYKQSDQNLYPPLKTDCFSRAIVAYYECQRCVELDGLASGVVERPNATTLSGQSFDSDRSVARYPRIDSLSTFAIALLLSAYFL